VFYQVLDPTLITVNGAHMVSDILRLCGGVNVFADLPILASRVDMEAVLAADPEAIVAGGTDTAWSEWRARWRGWPTLRAVQRDNLFFIPVDVIHRHGPRMLQGAETVCRALDQARARR
jgi:iron complex transport system substrate-binding protein